uniref:DUF7745 domain-containing protein n=1 Tax=Fagus sylvatica TaxID=28930 RepID=A0A2N9IVH6_FAGSY
MQHIAGKLSTSSFQRYKVCMNRSSDERVMAPGSRGIGAVFVHFSGEDSDQTGDAFGEPRVPRRSWSRYLSNAPGLVDQLVASRKDSAREGGYFDVLGTVGKLALPTSCKVPDSRKSELGLVRYGSATRGHRSVFVLTITSSFLVRFGPVKYRIEALITFFRMVQGSGQFDSAFGLVNSQVKLWSTLVKLGQPWSNLVNPGQTLGNVSRTFSLGVFDTTRLRWIMRAGSGSPRLACRHPRKSRGNDPDSLVTLNFHDFRVEWMRHWWTLLGEDDHADIMGIFGKFPFLMQLRVDRGLLEALASFWDPTHCCFSIGEVDLVPTLEEYAGLLQLDSPFSETPVIPIQGPRSNQGLEKYLGLTLAVLRPEIIRPEETWRKANISLDLLTKYFSWSDFLVELARDFIVGKRGWKKFRINAFKIAFAGIFLFPTSVGRIDLGVIPLVFSEGRSIVPAILCETVRSLSFCRRQGEGVPMFCSQLLQLWFCSHLQHFYRLQTPYHFERYTVKQTVKIALPFTGNSRDWALYLLDLPLSGWAWKVTWGPAVWMPWTHCALFDGVPLPGVWGCTGYYPSLALRQFGGVQYPPRLDDLDAVTFDYIPGEDMWRLLSRIEVIWEGRLSEVVLIEDGLPYGQDASYSLVSRSLRASAPTGPSERVAILERELEEARAELASLRLARASEREESTARVESMRSTLHHNSVAMANLRRDLEVQRGNVSTLRTMNDFIREQLEISEAAKDHMEETLTETQGQLETEQVERTRVQDELDSLRSYTQALVDPTTAFSRVTTESCRLRWTWCMTLLSPMLLGLTRRVSPWFTALHQINQVMDSLGARARAVLEEHDEG